MHRFNLSKLQTVTTQLYCSVVLLLLFLGNEAIAKVNLNDTICLENLKTLTQDSKHSNHELISELEKLQVICTSSPQIRHNLGVMHSRNGNFESAIPYFEEALELQPNARQSYESLKRIYRYRAAVAYRQAYLSNSPEPTVPELKFIDFSAVKMPDQQNSQYTNRTAQQLKSDIKPVLEGWWIKINAEPHEALPEYLIEDAGHSILVILNSPKNKTYSLRLKLSTSGWVIIKENTIP